jgi:hypothetical protein
VSGHCVLCGAIDYPVDERTGHLPSLRLWRLRIGARAQPPSGDQRAAENAWTALCGSIALSSINWRDQSTNTQSYGPGSRSWSVMPMRKCGNC